MHIINLFSKVSVFSLFVTVAIFASLCSGGHMAYAEGGDGDGDGDGDGGSYTYQYDYYTAPSYAVSSYDYSYSYPSSSYVSYSSSKKQHRPNCDTFTASEHRVTEGDTVSLTWFTTDANNVIIDHGIGNVNEDGSMNVRVDKNTTYNLTASYGDRRDSCSVSIVVEKKPVVRTTYSNSNYYSNNTSNSNTPRCDITASDRTIDEGDDVKLSWDNTRTDEIVIKDSRGKIIVDTEDSNRYDADSDSITVDPTRTTTYTLTAKNGSRKDTCSVKVTVDEDEDSNSSSGSSSQIPRCTLKISDSRIMSGDKVSLSWSNLRTDDVIITDRFGNEVANSRKDRGIDEDKDSITLRPTRSTQYTLEAKNGSRVKECTVAVTVTDEVTVARVRSQDGVALAQVPYTGFDATDVLSMILYGSMGVWLSIVGYAFWMKRRYSIVGENK